ncbi:MAG: hypothetical protein ACK4M9_12105 [Anaerobacillus sp.]|uniref:hypothetical protein n=1 Tax=Anaerobacillus sp. TaxID=1872506 RepID=UPI00391D0A42
MICKCGGLFVVKRIEEYPSELTNKEKLLYNRVCDVECVGCGEIQYSQPYDDGRTLNTVKKIKTDGC